MAGTSLCKHAGGKEKSYLIKCCTQKINIAKADSIFSCKIMINKTFTAVKPAVKFDYDTCMSPDVRLYMRLYHFVIYGLYLT